MVSINQLYYVPAQTPASVKQKKKKDEKNALHMSMQSGEAKPRAKCTEHSILLSIHVVFFFFLSRKPIIFPPTS